MSAHNESVTLQQNPKSGAPHHYDLNAYAQTQTLLPNRICCTLRKLAHNTTTICDLHNALRSQDAHSRALPPEHAAANIVMCGKEAESCRYERSTFTIAIPVLIVMYPAVGRIQYRSREESEANGRLKRGLAWKNQSCRCDVIYEQLRDCLVILCEGWYSKLGLRRMCLVTSYPEMAMTEPLYGIRMQSSRSVARHVPVFKIMLDLQESGRPAARICVLHSETLA